MIVAKQAQTKKKQKEIDKEFVDVVDSNIMTDKKLLERLSKA